MGPLGLSNATPSSMAVVEQVTRYRLHTPYFHASSFYLEHPSHLFSLGFPNAVGPHAWDHGRPVETPLTSAAAAFGTALHGQEATIKQ